MKAEFDKATIKVWFNTLSTSRNFDNVKSITTDGDLALIETKENNQHIINMANVNLIEEVASKY